MRVGIFNTAFVGDVALMGRLIDALSASGHEVVLFSNAAGCSLFQFDHRIGKRVVVRKQRGIGKVKSILAIARTIDAEKIDTLLLAHKSITSAIIAIAARVKNIVTFTNASLLHKVFRGVETLPSMHESERYLQLAKGLVPEATISSSRLEIFGDVNLCQFTIANPDFIQTCSGLYFVCAPGSVWRTKRYPAELLAELLCRLLVSLPRLTCVLSGGPSDAETMDETLMAIERRHPELIKGSRIVDARACLPLPELVELVRGAKFVLTPDSAPLHIASATRTKAFAFFGPTPFDTGFGPAEKISEIISFNNIKGTHLPCQPCSKHGHDICPLGHHKCLSDLPPDAIAARMLLSIPSD